MCAQWPQAVACIQQGTWIKRRAQGSPPPGAKGMPPCHPQAAPKNCESAGIAAPVTWKDGSASQHLARSSTGSLSLVGRVYLSVRTNK